MADSTDVNVDELRRRARRRLVGAIVLALGAAVFVPMLLESDPRPLGEDIAVRIPPVDDGKFVNRLNGSPTRESSKSSSAKGDVNKADAARLDVAKPEAGRAEASRNEAAAKVDAAKMEAAGSGVPSSTNADSAKAKPEAMKSDTAAVPPSAAKRSLADAEQKMLNGNNRNAPASASAGKPTPAASVAKSAPPPASNPALNAPAATPPSTSANAPQPRADGATDFSVQLAAFADDKGANSLVNKLKRAGYAAYTEPLTTSKGTLWRVRVGPFAARDAAATARDKLKGDGYSGIVAPSK